MTTEPSRPADGIDSATRPETRPRSRNLAAWLARSHVALGTVALAIALAFFAFHALPFMDLPAHAGLIALRHRIDGSPIEREFYVFAPHLGTYSLLRGVGEALLRVTSPLGAVRVLGALPVVCVPAAVLFARRRLHGDRSVTAGYAAMILCLGLMMIFGFASFLLGMAVVIVAMTVWLELLASTDRGAPLLRTGTIAFAALFPLVYFAHGFAFGLFGISAGVSCLAAGRWRARLPMLLSFVPAAAVAVRGSLIDRGVPEGSAPIPPDAVINFQGPVDKLSLLVSPTLMTRWGVDIAIGVVLWIVLVGGTYATVRVSRGEAPTEAERAHVRALVASSVVLGVLFLALPHEIGWFGFIDGRLVPLVLLFCLVAIRESSLGPRLRLLWSSFPVLAVFAGAILWTASALFQREAAGYEEVFAAIPDAARVLNLPIEPDSDVFTGHPFVHYDKLVMTERPIVPSDVWFHQGSAIFPTAKNPALHLPRGHRSSSVRRIDWSRFALEDWDYVLIRRRPDHDAPEVPDGLSLVVHRGGWWLYRTAGAPRSP